MDRTDYCYGRIDPFDNKTPYRCALRERGLAPGCKFFPFYFLLFLFSHTFFDLSSWTSSRETQDASSLLLPFFFYFIPTIPTFLMWRKSAQIREFFRRQKNVLCSLLLILVDIWSWSLDLDGFYMRKRIQIWWHRPMWHAAALERHCTCSSHRMCLG